VLAALGAVATLGASATAAAQAPSRRAPLPLSQAAWLQRLGSPDPATRRSVVIHMGRWWPTPDFSAVSLVRQAAMRDSDSSVRLAAVTTLAAWPQARVASALVTVVESGTLPEASSALRALAAIDERSFMELLTRMGGTTVLPAPSEGAMLGLAELSQQAFDRAIGLRTATARLLAPGALVLRGDPRWSAFLAASLRSAHRGAATETLDAIATLQATDLAETVASIVEHSTEPTDRRAALRCLARLGAVAYLDVVRDALGDPSLRWTALDAAAMLGDARLAPSVSTQLDAAWSADREAAAEALVTLSGPEARGPLELRLARERDASVRATLWHTLARTGAGAWTRAAEREAAGRWALVELALRDGPRIRLENLARWVRSGDPAAMRLAGLLGDDEAERLRALEAPDRGARIDAALSFESRRTPAAVDALVARWERENDERVRAAIVIALAGGSEDHARGHVAWVLAHETELGMPTMLASLVAAGTMRLDGVSEALQRAAEDGSAHERSAAVHALGRSGQRDAVPVVEQLALEETDERVRGTAWMALAALDGARALPVLRFASRVAWTRALADRAQRAERVARGEVPAGGPWGSAVAHVSGLEPGSVWATFAPDGSVQMAVASSDGELFFAHVTDARETMQRVDQ